MNVINRKFGHRFINLPHIHLFDSNILFFISLLYVEFQASLLLLIIIIIITIMLLPNGAKCQRAKT